MHGTQTGLSVSAGTGIFLVVGRICLMETPLAVPGTSARRITVEIIQIEIEIEIGIGIGIGIEIGIPIEAEKGTGLISIPISISIPAKTTSQRANAPDAYSSRR